MKTHGGNLDALLLKERNPSEKVTDYIIPTIWAYGKDKTYRYSKKIIGCQELGGQVGMVWICRAQMIFRAAKVICMML